jgi:DNA modification methylase
MATKNPADKVEHWSIDRLIPYARNSRTHSDSQVDQIASSIKEWGFTTAVLVDPEGGIIAGHGRVMAAKKLKMKELPVMVADNWSEEKKRAYIIADNKLALNAGWDNDLLSLELKELQSLDFDLSLMGFDDKELSALLEPEVVEGLTDEDAVPDVPEEPKTKIGDIYQLGNHRLMCGDSNSVNDLDKLLDGAYPNAIVTDPPYGIGIDGQKKSISSNPKHNRKFHEKKDWDSQRPEAGIFNWIVAMNVPSVIWGGNYFADLLPASRGWLYWNKGQDGLTMSDGELAWTTEDKPLRSKTINRGKLKGSVHPTQKPVEIMDFSIKYLKVPEKGAVLDLFAGSGTTAIACEKNKMRSYLMEQDPGYCDAIVKRWEDFTGKKAVLVSANSELSEI